MLTRVIRSVFLGLILSAFFAAAVQAQKVTLSVQADAPGKPISPDLFGIFFEDLNYAADGGLYAELIQTRSFEYQATEQPTWNSLSFWELAKRGGGEGKWAVEAARPLHPNNPHYVVLEVTKVAEGVGLSNPGFDGIAVKAGVGNEDAITPEFKERFKMIFDAVKAKHPEVTVIGTVGSFPEGEDFEEGWKLADGLRVPVVDEHYYKPPQWFFENLNRYDGYDRRRSKVYVGEYAAHDTGKKSTLRSALAEAAYMTQLERNGDMVHMASYAPLLAKQGHTQWTPDLIYFNNTRVAPTVNYYVQQMFGQNQGDAYVASALTGDPRPDGLASSTVRDGRTGDIIIKLVNSGPEPLPLRVELNGAKGISRQALKTVLAGDPAAVNTFDDPARAAPVTSGIQVDRQFDYEAPAHSLAVIRIRTR